MDPRWEARLERVIALAAQAAGAEADGGEWGRELLALVEAAAGAFGREEVGAAPAEAALFPFLAAAEAWLGEELARGGLKVLPSARRELRAVLSRRLTRLCARVLVFEQRALELTARAFGGPSRLEASAASWVDRFEQYPALAWLFTRTILQWRAFVGELLARLEQDSALLAGALFGGRPLHALAGVQGEAGDAHAGGRAVSILRFEDGRQVVYKPKDLRIARAVQELFAWLNAAGLSLPLHVYAVLPREGYAWEEFVPVASCRTAAEVGRFYRRAGLLLRVMQLLEARDLTLDNVLASGEHPVLVDTEMVLQPRRATEAARAPAQELLCESVARLGLLSSPFPIAPGVRAENLGALTPARELLTGMPFSPAHEALEGVPHPTREGRRLLRVGRHAPTLNDEPVCEGAWLPHLLEGYREMHALLLACRDALLAPGGPVAKLAGLPIRWVYRDTAAYLRPLWTGLAPELLAAPARRRSTCERLLDAASAAEDDLPILRAERTAINALDVPYFLCRTDGQALLGPDGSVVREGFFEGSALERVRRRLRELEDFPLPPHEELLQSTFATRGSAPAPARPRPAPPPGEPLAPDWLTAAAELGDLLLASALPAGGELTWVGLAYDPFHDYEVLAPLGPDLLSGSSGIALVLADLYAVSGHERFRSAALGALAGTRRAAARAPGELARAPRAPTVLPPPVGGFVGTGAWLHSLTRCAEALDAPELAAEANACAAALPLEALCAWALPDVVAGVGGLLLALARLDPGPRSRAAFEELERRLASTVAPQLPYPPGARVLDALPEVRGGLALCAARICGRAPPPRPAPEPTAGALLVDLALSAGSGEADPRLRVGALRFVEGPASDSAARLDRLEVALTAAAALGDARLFEQAARLGLEFLLDRRRTGRWFPDQPAADRHQLSALWGLPALAHAFLRLHAPARLPSLRLLR